LVLLAQSVPCQLVIFYGLNLKKSEKMVKINFHPTSSYKIPPSPQLELITHPFLLSSPLSYTMSNWTPDMQNFFDILNSPPIPTTAFDEFIDSSLPIITLMLRHHHALVHSFNLYQINCPILHHMITCHIHTLHLRSVRRVLLHCIHIHLPPPLRCIHIHLLLHMVTRHIHTLHLQPVR
jgi:hypothetical protein